MLYDRWRQVAADQSSELALHDFASGQRWTFGQLFAAGEKAHSPGEIIFPQGHSPEFILTLLGGWREEKTICPLEPGQAPPDLSKPPETFAHLKWTSGTTAASRAVAFTGKQLAADVDHILPAMGLKREWPNIGAVSLAHSYGFSNLILPLLLHGIPLVLVPAPLPELIRRAAGEYLNGVTIPAVPALWRAWHDACAITPELRLAISAGASLPLSLEQKVFEDTGLKLHNFYGSSECGGIAYDDSVIPRPDASLAGKPLPGVSLVLDPAGCLKIESKSVGETYWPEPAENLGGGVFQSRDNAELNDGLVYLRGRASDQINVAGRKLSPETVEQILLTHPLVKDCVVFGIASSDASRGEEIVAMIAGALDEGALRTFLLEKLPAWQVPRRWWFTPAIPVSARGKISRAECRARFRL